MGSHTWFQGLAKDGTYWGIRFAGYARSVKKDKLGGGRRRIERSVGVEVEGQRA